jgi:hypothetical protein
MLILRFYQLRDRALLFILGTLMLILLFYQLRYRELLFI